MDDIDSNFEDRMIAFRLWARNFQKYHILTWQELVVDASASLCQGQRWFAQWCSKSLWLKFVSVWEVLVGERTGIDILQELRPCAGAIHVCGCLKSFAGDLLLVIGPFGVEILEGGYLLAFSRLCLS